ncbi:M20/M25/M40 family metallo-hydrolase [Guptibacillus hwajinpoensis]|uniref:M20/M25/M40 family metallo-hydrolase n=1 Tax=Guptibacillus hwajinpoensis TaxID=208199 RepID=UPI001CD6EC55|nr:M20/M25/M40 family metallo-hydrolase [Pseudalkalibacillus hwajinpoensis]MCA0991976.1 M20/M25/M40 family metallo-hydrolase [Pseudalkalibacillus hwajinpoensis]
MGKAELWLRNLIKIDTTNEKQSEILAATYLKEELAKENIDSTILFSTANRASIVAKLHGCGKKEEPLVLLSHLDVVAANEQEWSYPPFSAAVAGEAIWGRGTLDTKQLTVMHLIAFISLKRKGFLLNRDIYFVSTADEENGSAEGMSYLAKTHPEIFNGATVLSEGGGFTVEGVDQCYMLYACGEKGTARVKLTATGEGGHAGSPPVNQAIDHLTHVLSLLQETGFASSTYNVEKFFKLRIKEQKLINDQLSFVRQLREYMSQLTYTVEHISIGEQLNVVPYKAEAIIEFRLLPYQTEKQFVEQIIPLLARKEVGVEILSFEQGYESDALSEMVQLFKKFSFRESRSMEWVPFTALGKTDGRFIGQNARNIYGLSPTLTPFTEVLKRVHQVDERIEIDSFQYGVEMMRNVVQEYCMMKGGGEVVSSSTRENESSD